MVAENNREARVIAITDERRRARKLAAAETGPRQHSPRHASRDRERRRSVISKDLTSVEETTKSTLLPEVFSEPRLRKWAQFVKHRLEGQYTVDEYGYDDELTDEIFLPILRNLYERYWRVEVRGIENVPAQGPAIIASNHSGVLPWDGYMLTMAIREEHPAAPMVRVHGADLVWALPFLSQWSRKCGNTVPNDSDTLRQIQENEIVCVFPEGTRGLGKPFADRYRLQRFSRTGFVSVALETGAPIIPVGIVGAEEIHPMVANATPLARLIGAPFFPITPSFPLLGLLGALPLPTKWIIEFGKPIDVSEFGPEAAQDAMTVFNIGDGVRDTIQQVLYQNLMQRRTWFW